jgi:hypothetical protein
MPKLTAHPVPLVPPPEWVKDLINQVVDELAHARGGWVHLSSDDVKDRLTAALHKAHESAVESARHKPDRR